MTKGNQKSIKEQTSVEPLQAELEHLRIENAYLKRLNALVQNKEKSPNKKKHIDYYNHKRIKAKLKGMSPVQYRTHALKAA